MGAICPRRYEKPENLDDKPDCYVEFCGSWGYDV